MYQRKKRIASSFTGKNDELVPMQQTQNELRRPLIALLGLPRPRLNHVSKQHFGRHRGNHAHVTLLHSDAEQLDAGVPLVPVVIARPVAHLVVVRSSAFGKSVSIEATIEAGRSMGRIEGVTDLARSCDSCLSVGTMTYERRPSYSIHCALEISLLESLFVVSVVILRNANSMHQHR